MPRSKKTVRRTAAKRIRLLIATRKGLWTLTSDVVAAQCADFVFAALARLIAEYCVDTGDTPSTGADVVIRVTMIE